ncbi:MAG: glycosyltransferase [Acidimicrobiales bacterium]
MSGPAPSPLRVLAWPGSRSQNPYTELLYAAVGAAARADGRTFEVVEFRPHRAWRERADVVHVHWPELCVEASSTPKALVKTAVVLFGLRVLTARGAALVWTRHNSSGHDQPHPRIERFLRRRFEAMVDGVIDLTDADSAPPNGAVCRVVIRHGDYAAALPLRDREEARRERGLEPENTLLASVGTIRPYKEVPMLVRAFAEATPRLPDARLLVAGRPASAELGREVATAAGRAPVALELGWLDDDAMAGALAAADVVVLSYRRLENSGVALLALTAGRPVAATDGPAVRDLLDLVGDEWVRPLAHPVGAASLVDLVQWARRPRTGRPDLSAFSWPEIGRRTLQFYDEVRCN